MTDQEIEAALDKLGRQRVTVERIKVPCKTLSMLLEKNGFPRGSTIDFMSIDVEGLELKIIQSFEWISWNIRVLMVEIDKEGAAYKIREAIAATGLYSKPFRIDKYHPDDIYVRKGI